MTCRQFANLTFAPQKNPRYRAATSRFIAINVTTRDSIAESFVFCKYFFSVLSFFYMQCRCSRIPAYNSARTDLPERPIEERRSACVRRPGRAGMKNHCTVNPAGKLFFPACLLFNSFLLYTVKSDCQQKNDPFYHHLRIRTYIHQYHTVAQHSQNQHPCNHVQNLTAASA